ncbi:MAG TPA: bacterial Ig-like domain-containing protein, partial [Bacillota bacterium]|nr:bacterial Ig-like domain-containing protein [Bacillota bacterium]
SFYFGDKYDLYITAKCDERHVFATGAEMLLQPDKGDIISSSYCVRLSDTEMRFVFEDIMVGINDGMAVSKVDLFIPTPVAGATPPTTITSYKKSITVSDVVWSPADSVFKEGTDYTVTVTIRAASGYILPQTVRKIYEKTASPDELALINKYFDEEFPLTATVNGNAATIDASKATLNGTKNDADYATAVVYKYTLSPAVKAQKPSITSQPKGGNYAVGTATALSVNASVADSGKLTYQWYRTSVNDISTISAIYSSTDASYGAQKSFTPLQDIGTTYYCVKVTNTLGSSSEYTYSSLIPVTYTERTNDPTVEGIEIQSKPTKLTYTKGETLNTAGMTVRVIMSDGYKNITSGFSCSPTTLNTVGTQRITVTYSSKTTTFDVKVNDIPSDIVLTSIEVLEMPTKTTYKTGEAFDPNGLVLKLNMTDGWLPGNNYDDMTFSPATLNTDGTQKITVTYKGKTTTIDVTVTGTASHTHSYAE